MFRYVYLRVPTVVGFRYLLFFFHSHFTSHLWIHFVRIMLHRICRYDPSVLYAYNVLSNLYHRTGTSLSSQPTRERARPRRRIRSSRPPTILVSLHMAREQQTRRYTHKHTRRSRDLDEGHLFGNQRGRLRT